MVGGKADLSLGTVQRNGPKASHRQLTHQQLRQDRNAQLPPDHDNGGIVVIDIQPFLRIDVRLGKQLADIVVGTLGGNDEGLIFQILQLQHSCLPQRIFCVDHCQQAVAEQRKNGEFIPGGECNEAGVDGIVHKGGFNCSIISVEHGNLHAGIALLKPGQDLRKQVDCGAGKRADAQAACREPPQIDGFVPDVLFQTQQLLHIC